MVLSSASVHFSLSSSSLNLEQHSRGQLPSLSALLTERTNIESSRASLLTPPGWREKKKRERERGDQSFAGRSATPTNSSGKLERKISAALVQPGDAQSMEGIRVRTNWVSLSGNTPKTNPKPQRSQRVWRGRSDTSNESILVLMGGSRTGQTRKMEALDLTFRIVSVS